MSDSLALSVAGRRLTRFRSYRVEADLYCADHWFGLQVADPGIAIAPGMRCELTVNDRLELTGIIDRVTDGVGKRGSDIRVEGRDLMGLLVDSYVEEFPDISGITLQALAERLLARVPFINRKAVVYQDGLAGARARATSSGADAAMRALGLEKAIAHIEPGQTIFEVLKTAAASRGATFFGLPDGTFVFGRPKAAGRPAFEIVHQATGKATNCFRSQRTRDISRRWSRITVVGQQQGNDGITPEAINVQATITDPAVPFHKPYVLVAEDNDSVSPAEQARMLLEMQRRDGFELVYSLPGHSQNGRNWAVNELARVRDGVRGEDGVFLIYARAFELSKREGRFTELRLGVPGVAA